MVKTNAQYQADFRERQRVALLEAQLEIMRLNNALSQAHGQIAILFNDSELAKMKQAIKDLQERQLTNDNTK